MKKKVVVLFTICFMFAFLQQYFNRNSELADFINSTLASVESLAQDEIGPDDCWLQPETKRCTLQLGVPLRVEHRACRTLTRSLPNHRD